MKIKYVILKLIMVTLAYVLIFAINNNITYYVLGIILNILCILCNYYSKQPYEAFKHLFFPFEPKTKFCIFFD